MKITRDKISKIITSIFIMLVLSIFIIVAIATISIYNKSNTLASSLDNLHDQTQATIDRQHICNNNTNITPQEAIHQRFIGIQPIAQDEQTTDFEPKSNALTDRINTITDECLELETDLNLMIQQLEINDRQSIMRFHIDELEILFRIVEAEATGGTIEQKQNVAWCILNRIDSDYFPNSITDVVFQPSQFSPLSDGRYYEVTITESTIQAVYNTLQGTGEHDGTFFMVRRWSDSDNVAWFDSALTLLFNDGIHEYFN